MPTPKVIPPTFAEAFDAGKIAGRRIIAEHPTWGLGHWTRYLDATQHAITAHAGVVGRIMFTERLRGVAHVIDTEALPRARRIAAEG